MRHQKAKMQNYMLGSLLDILAAAYGINTQGTFGNSAAQAYSQEFEAEADYVGLYIMALAGLEIENSANFWRRMAALHPGSIGRNHASSHPATAERFVAIEQTVLEIRQKQAGGLALTPEYQDDKAADEPQQQGHSH
jgi:predicted Zn-dependent protease